MTFNLLSYLAVGLVSGSIIAYEIAVMRVFSIGGWSHFGSMVISMAMFGFGAFSTFLCLRRDVFSRRPHWWMNLSLALLGPAMAVANSAAQTLPFNAIFLVSDPAQKWYLLGYFLIFFVPFFIGAMFLGLVFYEGQAVFGRVYFANMTGSGLGGLALLLSMYLLMPQKLPAVALVLWFLGAAALAVSRRETRLLPGLILAASLSLAAVLILPQIRLSPYKGVSYARKFPDSRLVHRAASPHGLMEIYGSSYFHFAPGLSDNVSLGLEKMPENAYLGMYFDGDGPVGVMKDLPESETGYFRYLPMHLPYLVKDKPDVFVMQFGGGISTRVALQAGARSVTAAEGNPMVVDAFRRVPDVAAFTGHILDDPRVRLVPYNGRIFIGRKRDAYDIIDLSLADSTGLSSPGGYAIYEKYLYTEESFRACLRALRGGGLLAVTVWNKEDPPKSTLKLLATIVGAARAEDGADVPRSFFVAHTYLSTMTVLYKKGGFTPGEIGRLRDCCSAMSFETVYYPGKPADRENRDALLAAYRQIYFAPPGEAESDSAVDLSAGHLYSLAADDLIRGDDAPLARGYVFDTRPLTDDRPYFAGYIKPGDIPHFLGQMESVSDEWGYLLLWGTLGVSLLLGLLIVAMPMLFGWKALFAPNPGKVAVIVYFSCLGAGYMLVEVGLISKYMLVLENPSVSASVLITGMLVFSGVGSWLSGRFLERPRRTLAAAALATAGILLAYAFTLDAVLGAAGFWPYPVRIAACLALLFPPAFFMGFPFALGMGVLSKLRRERFFVWAWGINGAFSVVGSVAVPIIAVLFGLKAVLLLAAALYALALPAFVRFARPEGIAA